MVVIEQGKGFPVAVLKKNVPVFYAVPAAAYEALIDKLDDMELAQIVHEREGQPSRVITLDEL
ncbi:Phd_YefM [Methylophaga frappieri]|uniref:Phd_YefM n=2 Tax=Methylophaga frappieri (strain ATCC BAA-2434 / DSM 25690 / JAM7) TaxID=754477 RepID=I1YI37_METFJ|nr:antitoxin of toxin-antitoxin stability system [Methylophaga frappieri]AFJ02580.1 Phd_YefM [Methylophaga frappieri]